MNAEPPSAFDFESRALCLWEQIDNRACEEPYGQKHGKHQANQMMERPRGDTSAAGRCCDERLVHEPIARAGAEGQPVTDRAMFEAAL